MGRLPGYSKNQSRNPRPVGSFRRTPSRHELRLSSFAPPANCALLRAFNPDLQAIAAFGQVASRTLAVKCPVTNCNRPDLGAWSPGQPPSSDRDPECGGPLHAAGGHRFLAGPAAGALDAAAVDHAVSVAGSAATRKKMIDKHPSFLIEHRPESRRLQRPRILESESPCGRGAPRPSWSRAGCLAHARLIFFEA